MTSWQQTCIVQPHAPILTPPALSNSRTLRRDSTNWLIFWEKYSKAEDGPLYFSGRHFFAKKMIQSMTLTARLAKENGSTSNHHHCFLTSCLNLSGAKTKYKTIDENEIDYIPSNDHISIFWRTYSYKQKPRQTRWRGTFWINTRGKKITLFYYIIHYSFPKRGACEAVWLLEEM